VKLFDLLRPECIKPGIEFPDKNAAIREIAILARKSLPLRDIDEEKIFQGLQQREKIGSTGFGNGIAIPHCRLDAVRDFVVGILTVPNGVDFEAMDGQKVHVIVFIVAPARESEAGRRNC